MSQSYKPLTWKDHVVDTTKNEVLQQGTPVSASNLNHMEEGIDLAHQKLEGANRQTQSISHGLQVINGDVNAPVSLQMEGRTLASLLNTELDAAKYYLLADKKTKLKFSDSLTVQGIAKFQGLNAKAQVITRTANFENKTTGSTLENPHIGKEYYNMDTPYSPGNVNWVEHSQSNYSQVNTQNGAGRETKSLTTNPGRFPGHLSIFNAVEEIERNVGRIPRNTLAEKIQWLKDNLARITINWVGYGSGPAGSKAYFRMFDVTNNSWVLGQASHTSGTFTKLPATETTAANIARLIDANGLIYGIAYPDAGDSVTPGSINTDYVEIEFELKPGVTLHAPRVPLYEVTKEHYDAALVTWNEDEILRRYPAVEGIQHIQNPYIIAEGENLLPPFSEWNLNATGSTSVTTNIMDDPYKLTSVLSLGTTVVHDYYLDVVPGQTYRIKAEGEGDGNPYVLVRANDGSSILAGVSVNTGGVFTVPSNVKRIYIRFYNGITSGPVTFTVKNARLTLGSTEKSFVPKNASYMYIESKLGAIGTSKDVLYEQDGKMVIRKAIEKDMVLDASLGWTITTNQVFDGFKEFYNKGAVSNVPATTPTGGGVLSKYNGALLTKLISNAINGGIDSFYFTSYNDNALYVRVANTESGFAQSYTPTGDEVKAYFNGWQVKTADATTNKPTAWKSIVDGSDAPTQTLAYVLANKATGYIPYKLSYVLNTPVIAEPKTEGSISVVGLTQVEVGSGTIVREKTRANYSGTTFIINANNLTDKLANRTAKIIQIYRNGVPDSRWSIISSNYAWGTYRAVIQPTEYDASAEYTVSYVMLDKTAFSTNALVATATFANNIRTALDDNVKVTEDNKREISIQALQIYNMLVRMKAGGI